jgi:predicted RNA-binding protein YlxR (DUF448 family)/ribosomal protein L7Ae-like RNA K-turn-binding protein
MRPTVEAPMNEDRPSREKRAPTRTCVGCGSRDDAGEMVRLVVADGVVAFDLAGGAFGRGAHVHARPACLAKAPRGLSRAFHREVTLDPKELGFALVAACDRRMGGLVLAARRQRAVAIGTDASMEALRGGASLAIVATDAGAVASSTEVARAVVAGRAVAWSTKDELGALLGAESIAICAVKHERIATELKRVRAAAVAGASAMGEDAECRRPEAR